MNYTELKKEYVIETLGKGARVIMCDFATMRMLECVELSVAAVNSFIEKPETKFFKVTTNE